MIKRYHLVLLTFALAFAAGCSRPEGKASASAPTTYKKGALSFEYPNSWKRDKESDTDLGGFQLVMLNLPDNDLCIVELVDFDPEVSLEDLAHEFGGDASPDGFLTKSSKSEFIEHGEKDGFERIDEKFVVKVAGIGTDMVRSYQSKVIGEKRLLLIFQCADDAPAKVWDGLDRVKKSIVVEPQAN
jgi:hypothetical protein